MWPDNFYASSAQRSCCRKMPSSLSSRSSRHRLHGLNAARTPDRRPFNVRDSDGGKERAIELVHGLCDARLRRGTVGGTLEHAMGSLSISIARTLRTMTLTCADCRTSSVSTNTRASTAPLEGPIRVPQAASALGPKKCWNTPGSVTSRVARPLKRSTKGCEHDSGWSAIGIVALHGDSKLLLSWKRESLAPCPGADPRWMTRLASEGSSSHSIASMLTSVRWLAAECC